MSLFQKYQWKMGPEIYLEDVEFSKGLLGKPGIDIACVYQAIALERCTVALIYHLQGQAAEAARHGREIPKEAADYFFGGWRSSTPTREGTLSAEWWTAHTPWMRPFIQSVTWAASLGLWEEAAKLARYPSQDCNRDIEISEALREFYLLLAAFLIAEESFDDEALTSAISRFAKHNTIHLFLTLRALAQQNSTEFEASLNLSLNHFAKRGFNKGSLLTLVSYEATILLHLGTRAGIHSTLSPSLQEFVIPAYR